MLGGREDLRVVVGGDVVPFTRAMANARQTLDREANTMRGRLSRFERGVATSMGNAGRAVFNMRNAMVLAAGATGLAFFARRAIEAADDIGKTARSIGLSAEALQELRFAAGRSGLEVSEFDRLMQIFTRNIGKAVSGSKEQAQAFRDLGFSVADLRGQAPDVLLQEVARRLQGVGDATTRARIQAELFGRSGVRAASLLAADIGGLREEARQLGVVISDDMIARAEEANDRLGDMGQVLRVAGLNLALEFMPVMRELANLFTSGGFQRGVSESADGLREMIEFMVEHKDVVAAVSGALAGMAVGRLAGAPGMAIGGVGGAVLGLEAARTELEDVERQIAQLERNARHFESMASSGQKPLSSLFGFDDFNEAARKARQEIAALEARREELLSSPVPPAGRGAGTGLGRGAGGTDDAAKEAADKVREAIERLHLQVRIAEGEFAGLEDGTAALAASLGILDGGFVDLGNGVTQLSPELAELDDLQRRLALAHEAAAAAARRQKQATRELNEEVERGQDVTEQLAAQIDSSADSMLDSITRLAETGQLTWENMLKSMLLSWIRFAGDLALQQASGGKSLGQLLAPLITGALGGAFGGGLGFDGAGGASFFPGSIFHKGGIAGVTAAPLRPVPAAAYLSAPRLHAGTPPSMGGNVGRELFAILDRGEAVLTERHQRNALAMMGAGTGGGGDVHIHNYAGAEVSTSPRQGGGMDVFVRAAKQAMADDFLGGGEVSRAAAEGFGLQRVPR